MEESHGADWWLRAAERDQAVAERLMKVGFHEGVGQHLSEAAQKYLKAVLAHGGRKTRAKSCGELLEEIAEDVTVPEDVSEAAGVLDSPPRKKKVKSLDDFPSRVDDADAIERLADHLKVVKAFSEGACGR
jgi:hypothetical protein